MELSSKIVLNRWAYCLYEGVGYSNPACFYRDFTREEIEEFMDDWVEDNAHEDFDNKTFVLFATRGIRNSLNWDVITRKAEEWAWRFFVADLFWDEPDADYTGLWCEIERETDFEW